MMEYQTRKYIRYKPTIHSRELKYLHKQEKYFLLLSDQTCIVGGEFEIMKKWRRNYREKPIVDMFETTKRINAGITSLSKLIDYNPQPEEDTRDFAW